MIFCQAAQDSPLELLNPRLVKYHLELRAETLGRLRQQVVEVFLDEFLSGFLARSCGFDHRVRLGNRI